MSGGELQPCGTVAAYARHRRAGEEACEACRKARAAYTRSRYVPSDRQLSPCGTTGAYQRHLRRGEETCQACRDAYDAKRASAPGPSSHGTYGAYQMHVQAGQTPCADCREAMRLYQIDYRARVAAARERSSIFDQMLAEAWAEVSAS